MAVLYARVGGAWVPVGGGSDEVHIGTTEPTDSAVELWYDTDQAVAAGGTYGSGLDAAKPAAPTFAGYQYFATDTLRLWMWNGSGWGIIGGKVPRVICGRSGAQAMPNGQAAFQWNIEDIDTDGFHNTSTNSDRITFPIAGRYHVEVCVGWDAHTTGARAAWFDIGGTRYGQSEVPPGQAGYGSTLMLSHEFAVTVGVILTVQGYQTSGANLNANGSPTNNFFAAQYLGPNW